MSHPSMTHSEKTCAALTLLLSVLVLALALTLVWMDRRIRALEAPQPEPVRIHFRTAPSLGVPVESPSFTI